MVNRSVERIPVRSEPPGAVVSVDCGNAPLFGGTTPTVIEVPRVADACSITIAKEGFAEQHIDFQRQLSRATLGNQVPGIFAGTFFSVVALALTWETDDVDFVIDAFRGGHAVGSAAGHAIDQRTGRAYKWVPGEVSVKLERAPD